MTAPSRQARAQQQRRLYAVRQLAPRPAVTWKTRLIQAAVWAAVWAAVGVLVLVFAALALILGWGLYLLGEHVVRGGSGW